MKKSLKIFNCLIEIEIAKSLIWYIIDNKGYKRYFILSLHRVVSNDNLNLYGFILGPLAVSFGFI